jgi:hypothetical protein
MKISAGATVTETVTEAGLTEVGVLQMIGLIGAPGRN